MNRGALKKKLKNVAEEICNAAGVMKHRYLAKALMLSKSAFMSKLFSFLGISNNILYLIIGMVRVG